MKWIKGIPSAEEVAVHELLHPGPPTRNDGIRLGHITVSREGNPGGKYVKVEKEDSYGHWLCRQPEGGHFGPYMGILRLRVVNGEVLQAVGFCQWMPLSDCKKWAPQCSYFPVGADGLPIDYEVKNG